MSAVEGAKPSDNRNLCQLVTLFSTSIRQRIIRLLSSGDSYTFTDILNHLRSYDENIRSNNLSYHLKELGDLIEQNSKAEYKITPKGQYIKEILDDLEATENIIEKGVLGSDITSRPIMDIEKVLVGGMLVKVSPKNFLTIVKEMNSPVIHSKIGTFRPKELYLSCINGTNYYCKSKNMIEGLDRVSEALRVEIPKNMIMEI